MNQTSPKTFKSIDEIDEGGSYELRDGLYVRVQEPTAPAGPGARAVEPVIDSSDRADARTGAAVGAAIGAPPSVAEASAARKAAKAS